MTERHICTWLGCGYSAEVIVDGEEYCLEHSRGVVGRRTKVKSDGGSTSYYQLPKDAKEIQDLVEFRNMNYSVANIFTSAYRLGQKDGVTDEYDLNKIVWFAQRELTRIKKGKPS